MTAENKSPFVTYARRFTVILGAAICLGGCELFDRDDHKYDRDRRDSRVDDRRDSRRNDDRRNDRSGDRAGDRRDSEPRSDRRDDAGR